MIKYGTRLIYDADTGKILNNILNKMCGNLPLDFRPKHIEYLDLEYDDVRYDNAEKCYIDVKNKELIIEEYIKKHESEEEKLRREKEELENQLLLKENKDLGGIL